jgi:hypothetical protein
VIEYPLGWSCELILVRLERYLAETLPYKEALALAEHVEACESCAHRLVLVASNRGGVVSATQRRRSD